MFLLTPKLDGETTVYENTLMQTLSVAKLLPKRERNTHKGSYGKAAIIAGSEAYSGAAMLSVASCLRSGVGYTALFTPKNLLPAFYLQEVEALLIPSNEGGRYAFNEKTMAQVCDYFAVAYGMGMGNSEEVAYGAKWLLKHYQGKLLLDADGLNALAKFCFDEMKELFANKKCDVVITPHIKEFSRLTGESVDEILEKGFFAPCDFAKEYGVTVLLKNAVSLIAGEGKIAVNTSGCSGQAKGGSGDVLSGLVAGLLAQGLTAFDAACVGAYLAGTSAELVAAEKGEYAMLPRDVIEKLPTAFLTIENQA